MTDHDDGPWDCPPHTKAKHEMLAKYLDAWYPIIASSNGHLVFLDGFAGRGRYTDGSEGSPLIALRRLIDHRFWPRMSDREFIFIFVEHDQQNAGSLQAEINAFQAQRQPWPANVKTEVVHGTFDLTATEILEQLRAQKANLAPTFAFVDPFGYSGLPMKLLAELLAYPKTELFVNFMVGHVQRFITRDKQQRVMGELFGIDVDEVLKDWDPADVGRVEHLRAVYERQLKEVIGFDYVQSFGMVIETGNVGYYLVHGTRHPEGVRKMKAAMWGVDPGGGYRFCDRTAGPVSTVSLPFSSHTIVAKADRAVAPSRPLIRIVYKPGRCGHAAIVQPDLVSRQRRNLMTEHADPWAYSAMLAGSGLRRALAGVRIVRWQAMAPERYATPSPATITTLPEQLRRSLTWDQGAEMAEHAKLRIDAGLAVHFCNRHSPWQRGTNENTNGLLRQ